MIVFSVCIVPIVKTMRASGQSFILLRTRTRAGEEMRQYAGMRNALAAVKAHAQYITLDNDSDGIKSALDKFKK